MCSAPKTTALLWAGLWEWSQLDVYNIVFNYGPEFFCTLYNFHDIFYYIKHYIILNLSTQLIIKHFVPYIDLENGIFTKNYFNSPFLENAMGLYRS